MALAAKQAVLVLKALSARKATMPHQARLIANGAQGAAGKVDEVRMERKEETDFRAETAEI